MSQDPLPQSGWYFPGAIPPPPPQPGVVPLRPLTVGELIDGTFRAIRMSPGVYFLPSLVTMGAIGLVGGILGFLLLRSAPSGAQGALDSTDPFSSLAGYEDAGAEALSSIGSGLAAPLVWIASLLLEGLVAICVSDAVLGRRMRLAEAWGRLRPVVGRLIGAMLLAGLIQVGVLAVGGAVWLLVFVAVLAGTGPGALTELAENGAPALDGAAVQHLLAALGVSALALLLAAAVLAFFAVRLAFVPIAASVEGAHPTAAIRRSFALTRRGFWRILGRILLVNVLAGIAAGVVGAIPSALAAASVDAIGLGLAAVVATVGATLANGLALPITTAFLALAYVDERIRKEDLAPVLARAAGTR